jgi:CheY-like chemotaxis protein
VAVASAPAAGAADGPATEPSDDADVDRTTVLVVEDNADVRAYVRSILAPGYRVLEAANGRAGLEAARTALPDLVLADVMMPELDGLALVEALKADAETDAIPVVLLTARGRAEDHADGLRRGAEAYLPKPFDPAVLEAQVTTILTERRRLRARLQAATPAAGSPGGAVLPDAADAAGASEAGAAGLSRAAGPTDALRPGAHPSAAAHRLDGSALQSSLADALRAAAAPHLGDPDFNPEALARAVGLHYRQFARRLQAEHGTTPSRFLRTLRVERAAGLLRDGAGSVTEVAYAVGFNSLSYFNRAFRERYDVAPSEVLTAIR